MASGSSPSWCILGSAPFAEIRDLDQMVGKGERVWILAKLPDSNRLRGVEGTLWAAYNGVTEWLDHRKIRGFPN